MDEPTYFDTPAAFRRWLAQHAATASELLVGFHKVDSGRPSMSWSESVDEALCFGWIDGVRRRIDSATYSIRFTPRKPDSIWSAVNIAKVQALEAAGRMTPAGSATFARRREDKTAVYAYEQDGTATLTAEEEERFRREAGAWDWWQSAPPSYRRVALHRITTAKKPETRAARLERLIRASAAGERW